MFVVVGDVDPTVDAQRQRTAAAHITAGSTSVYRLCLPAGRSLIRVDKVAGTSIVGTEVDVARVVQHQRCVVEFSSQDGLLMPAGIVAKGEGETAIVCPVADARVAAIVQYHRHTGATDRVGHLVVPAGGIPECNFDQVDVGLVAEDRIAVLRKQQRTE